MRSGWKKIGGKWYYFADGAMQTGWKKIGGKWYFFKSSGIYDSSKDGKISSSLPVTIDLAELSSGYLMLDYGRENDLNYHPSGNYPPGVETMTFGANNTISGDFAGNNGKGCRYTGKFTSVKLVDGYYKSKSDCMILVSAKLTEFNKVYSNGHTYYNSKAEKYVTASNHPVLEKGKTYYFYIIHMYGDGGGSYTELLDSNKKFTSYYEGWGCF